jgi:serine/threonine-protein kinase RsbW
MNASVATAPAVLSIQASTTEARGASSWLEAEANARGVPDEHVRRLDHCLDEALANVVAHGGPAARASPVTVNLEVRRSRDGGVAAVTVSDSGVAFDPLPVLAMPKSGPASLADAMPGGLGLTMIRSYSDSVGYRHSDGRNHLTFSVRWGAPA